MYLSLLYCKCGDVTIFLTSSFTHCELTAVAAEALAGMLRQNNTLKTL